ncbi:helix-turn-helix domain-containing protein [Acidocella facilis]|uniref:helix-turn-helix domain-containing protein n=1 Tax=Acidocella facilis TaxID=525 RepID=UPI001F32BFB9|nr:helix-turn-helix domain-containing protein [Acidocella facilis]
MSETKSQYISIKDAAAICGVSINTIYRALRSGDLTAYKRGGRVLIDRAIIDNYVKAKPWRPTTGYADT